MQYVFHQILLLTRREAANQADTMTAMLVCAFAYMQSESVKFIDVGSQYFITAYIWILTESDISEQSNAVTHRC